MEAPNFTPTRTNERISAADLPGGGAGGQDGLVGDVKKSGKKCPGDVIQDVITSRRVERRISQKSHRHSLKK